jgi:hypothetical protein
MMISHGRPSSPVEENRIEWRKIKEIFEKTGARPPAPWTWSGKTWSSYYTVLKMRYKSKRGISQLDKSEKKSQETGFRTELDIFPESFRVLIALRIGAEALGRVVKVP